MMRSAESITKTKTYDPRTRRPATAAGVLFLVATMTFMAGDTLIAEHFNGPAAAGKATLAVGVALQALCGLAGAGVGSAMLTVIGRSRLAYGYLGLRSLEALMIIGIGAYVLSAERLVADYELFIYGFTGAAGLILSYLLLAQKLVPAWLSRLGIVGYLALLAAIPSGFLGITTLGEGAGMLFYVPGGLFELVLPILLIAKGFRRQEADTVAAPLPGSGPALATA